jgi:hypothetical protein
MTKTVNSFIQFIRKHSRRQGSFQAAVLRSSSPMPTGLADGPLLPPKKFLLRGYPSKLILNVDETPLHFEFLSGYTYDWKGVTTVAGKYDRSGWDKRQATIVHIMANVDTPFEPILIFYGQGTVIIKERPRCDPRVNVYFNPIAYHNECFWSGWRLRTILHRQPGRRGRREHGGHGCCSVSQDPPIMKFLREAVTPMLTALIPPGSQVICSP